MRFPLLEQGPSPLCPDEVRVFFAAPETVRDPALLRAYEEWLSPDERGRRARFYFEKDRHLFLVAHALVRASLSRAAPGDPASWRFEAGPHGRPEVARAPGLPPVRFNLSHTRGLVMVGLADESDIGVDVERIDPARATLEIASRFFAPAETATLRALAPEAGTARFFAYWTLKEAYIKAVGAGLSLPLDRFSFDLDAAPSPRIAFAPPLSDDPAAWQFARLAPTEHHAAALALRRGRSAPVALRAWHTLPGIDEAPLAPAEPPPSPAR